MSKQLYIVTVEHLGIVYAESPSEAEDMAKEIASTECFPHVESEPFDPNDPGQYWPADWDDDTLVYHKDKGDITVAQAAALLKEKP